MNKVIKSGFTVIAGSLLMIASGFAQPASDSENAIYLMIRADDIGMSHSVNMALKELLETGYPVSASVMFACPWYKEAVAILKDYREQTSVGIHLTLNSEWENYRWGPVTGREAVPSLVDDDGFFHHTTDPLKKNPPEPAELEKELRAQIERALKSGLEIDYVDYHMGIRGIPGFIEISEKLAAEYNLGMWGDYKTPRWDSQYAAHPASKADSLLAMADRFEPGYNYLMVHVGIDDSELRAMRDMNAGGSLSVEMSAHRQGELNALTSEAFARALRKNKITLVTFRDLMEERGVEGLERLMVNE